MRCYPLVCAWTGGWGEEGKNIDHRGRDQSAIVAAIYWYYQPVAETRTYFRAVRREQEIFVFRCDAAAARKLHSGAGASCLAAKIKNKNHRLKSTPLFSC